MDETRIHDLARRVGGRFRLASLVQKRLLELNRGQRPLINQNHRNPLYTVLQEIEEGKIDLLGPADEEQGESGGGPSLDAGAHELGSL